MKLARNRSTGTAQRGVRGQPRARPRCAWPWRPGAAAPGAAASPRQARCGCAFPGPAPAPRRRCWSTPPAASRAAIAWASRSRWKSGARLVVTTAAAEKIYRTDGPQASVAVTATLAADAELTWLPQETILFDRARLARTVDIAMAPTARLAVRRGRHVRPLRHGRDGPRRPFLRPLAGAARRQAGVRGEFPARRRDRRPARRSRHRRRPCRARRPC